MTRQLEPGPDHPINVSPARATVRVRFNGRTIAESEAALELLEASYPPVFYIPRADADMSLLERTSHCTHCPYKGDASYYSVVSNGTRSENAAWSYEAPYPAMSAISGYLSFYPDRVDAIEVS